MLHLFGVHHLASPRSLLDELREKGKNLFINRANIIVNCLDVLVKSHPDFVERDVQCKKLLIQISSGHCSQLQG